MKYEIVNSKSKMAGGSALVLVVVLSALLALIGTLFILRSSVDSVGTRSVADNKEMQYAVDTVIEQLSRQLILDVPGAAGQEYQDYPFANSARGPFRVTEVYSGANAMAYNKLLATTDNNWLKDDRWLASLEPYVDSTDNYRWSHVSDLYGDRRWLDPAVNIDPDPAKNTTQRLPSATSDILLDATTAIIVDGIPIDKAAANSFTAKPPLADADGDGIADAIWVPVRTEIVPYDYAYYSTAAAPGSPVIDDTKLPKDLNRYLRTGRGQQVYVAIRVVDLGGMLNVNTGYRMDPNDKNDLSRGIGWVDGTRPFQVCAAALAGRPTMPFSRTDANDLLQARTGSANPAVFNDLNAYENSVSRRLDDPMGYAPFDVGDELEMRYRYLLNMEASDTRLEEWGGEFRPAPSQWLSVPRTLPSELPGWFRRVMDGAAGYVPVPPPVGPLAPYDYRHIATTYNCDRLLAPDGTAMVNINTGSVNAIYGALKNAFHANTAVDPNTKRDLTQQAAQLAANIVDFRDIHAAFRDDTVTAFAPADLIAMGGEKVWGFDRPRIVLSEVACKSEPNVSAPGTFDVGYAVETYLLDDCTYDVNDWRIVVKDSIGGIKSATLLGNGGRSAGAKIIIKGGVAGVIGTIGSPPSVYEPNDPGLLLSLGDVVELQRIDSLNNWVVWDGKTIDDPNIELIKVGGGQWSVERNVNDFQWIKHWWYSPTGLMTLGFVYNPMGGFPIPAETEDSSTNRAFHTIGDLGMVFAVDTRTIGMMAEEATTRVDWKNPKFADIPKYLTTMVPLSGNRVFGRVNINTAPWFVIGQLPWVSDRRVGGTGTFWENYKLARAIVAYRDMRKAGVGGPSYTIRAGSIGFGSIAELSNVNGPASDPNDPNPGDYRIDWYTTDVNDLTWLPRVFENMGSGTPYDFEERDVILSRMSNLATVRSDSFCAYILVRLGEDGPQRRYIAILDRSGVNGKVKVRALQPVADPR